MCRRMYQVTDRKSCHFLIHIQLRMLYYLHKFLLTYKSSDYIGQIWLILIILSELSFINPCLNISEKICFHLPDSWEIGPQKFPNHSKDHLIDHIWSERKCRLFCSLLRILRNCSKFNIWFAWLEYSNFISLSR